MTAETVSIAIKTQKDFFEKGGTRNVEKRIEYIRRIKEYIVKNENAIAAALKADLGRTSHISVK